MKENLVDKVTHTWTREPVAIIGAMVALIEAVIGLLIAFGVDMTAEQSQAIIAVAIAAGPVIGLLLNLLFVRPRVTPVADPRTERGEPAELMVVS